MGILIITGGQRGVDIGATRGARRAGALVGGWVPSRHGDLYTSYCESGDIPGDVVEAYQPLQGGYAMRTRRNLGAAQHLLIIAPTKDVSAWTPGTRMTYDLARAARPPVPTAITTMGEGARAAGDQIAYAEAFYDALANVRGWLKGLPDGTRVMVAGPRESKWPGCEKWVEDFMFNVLDRHSAV